MARGKSNRPKSFEILVGSPFKLKLRFEPEEQSDDDHSSKDDDVARYKLTHIGIGNMLISFLFVPAAFWAIKVSGFINKVRELIGF